MGAPVSKSKTNYYEEFVFRVVELSEEQAENLDELVKIIETQCRGYVAVDDTAPVRICFETEEDAVIFKVFGL